MKIKKYEIQFCFPLAAAGASADGMREGRCRNDGMAPPPKNRQPAGDPVACRLSIDNGDPSPEAETRTAYGPLTNGFWPIYWRSGDRVEVISPQTTPQRATVEVRVSGATESEAI